jgi:hypothetical protein
LSETSNHPEKINLLSVLSRDRRKPKCSIIELRPDSFLLGEGFHVQLDYDVRTTEKCMPMLEKNKKQVQEGEGEISDLSKPIRKRVPRQLTKQMSMSQSSLSVPVDSHSGSNGEGTAGIGDDQDNTQSHIFSEGTLQITDQREGIPVSTVTENTAFKLVRILKRAA